MDSEGIERIMDEKFDEFSQMFNERFKAIDLKLLQIERSLGSLDLNDQFWKKVTEKKEDHKAGNLAMADPFTILG